MFTWTRTWPARICHHTTKVALLSPSGATLNRATAKGHGACLPMDTPALVSEPVITSYGKSSGYARKRVMLDHLAREDMVQSVAYTSD